ncbi:MAG: ECF transporter S component [Clostridiaceae bacterium]|nr:ECF transporter S component [Clostridiaceae bacterium]
MEEKVIIDAKGSNKTKDLVLTGLLTAFVFIATFINFQLPISIHGGLVHLGTPMLIITSVVFGAKKGAIAGAFGMGLFDLFGGWVAWAPFTFIIRGVMGWAIGTLANGKDRNGNNTLWNIVAIVVSGIWMIVGYYIAEAIIYGNWITPITSVPGDSMQIVLGILLGLPMITALKKTKIL